MRFGYCPKSEGSVCTIQTINAVKPFDVWLDAIGQDGKKIPYRVKRGTIWRLVWCGGEQSFKEFTGPDKMHITLPDEYVEKYFKKV